MKIRQTKISDLVIALSLQTEETGIDVTKTSATLNVTAEDLARQHGHQDILPLFHRSAMVPRSKIRKLK